MLKYVSQSQKQSPKMIDRGCYFTVTKELLSIGTKEVGARGSSPDVLENNVTINLIRNNYFSSERP